MATASSAQREPSMEEILASIRRIIEDSDSGRKPTENAGDLRQDLEPGPDATAAEEPVAEVDAFRAELRADPEPKKPATLAEVQTQVTTSKPVFPRMEVLAETGDGPKRPPLTLAEVGAQIAAEQASAKLSEAARTSPATPPQAETGEEKSPEASAAIIADWKRDIIKAPPVAETRPIFDQPQADTQDEQEIEISEDDLAEEAAADFISSLGAESEGFGETTVARPAIVSEHVGRQVAAAFGELSEAFAARSRKSFDEMAEDMLRPMLQDWLDNNLPTLVERLVREEIERVARGAQ